MLTYGIPLITDFQWRKRLRKKVPKEEQSEQKPRMNEVENYIEKTFMSSASLASSPSLLNCSTLMTF